MSGVVRAIKGLVKTSSHSMRHDAPLCRAMFGIDDQPHMILPGDELCGFSLLDDFGVMAQQRINGFFRLTFGKATWKGCNGCFGA